MLADRWNLYFLNVMNLKHDAKKGVPPSVCIHFRLESEVWSWGPPECVVICCKHSMKEAESKITGFVHLLKRRKSSVLKCLCLCCGSGHSKPPRQQCLWHCFCARMENMLQRWHYLYLPISTISAVHNACFAAGIRARIACQGQAACSQCELAGRSALQLPATN